MRDDSIDDRTRRAILEGVAASLGVAVAGGVASAHPGAGDHDDGTHPHARIDQRGTGWAGYHSLGGETGEDAVGGQPTNPHYGGISELKVQDGIAYVGILSSKSPTPDRGVAILDVTEYTDAESKAELDEAEMYLLSFVPNENNATSVMDVRPSADGNYLFLSKQPIAALFLDAGAHTDPSNVGNSPESGGIVAVDVSDPNVPEIVGRWDAWGLGPHNSDHLRIGGTDYVFAVKGSIGSNAGIYVVRFDRTTGTMTLVNQWLDGQNFGAGEAYNLAKGQYATRGYDFYVHDIRVERDPQTGWPLAYVANLNDGAYVLDAADPRHLETLGHFDMYRAHEIWPITVTVDGGRKRLFVAGQENPSSTWSDGFGSHGQNIDGDTGWLYLVDAQDISPGDQSEPIDLGAAREHEAFDGNGPLARWQLSDDITFDNYTLSLHNVDPIEAFDAEGRLRQFVACGHYHAGLRILEFTDALRATPDLSDDRYIGNDNTAWPDPPANGETDGMGQVAYFRSHAEDVPADSKFGNLTAATPDFWCAVQENGVIFGSGINTGLYATTLDDPSLPVGDHRELTVDVERVDDSDVFTAGQTNRITLETVSSDTALIRDRIPSDWTVQQRDGEYFGHVARVEDAGDGKLVYFEREVVAGTDSLTYFVTAPSETGIDTLGRTHVVRSEDGQPARGANWEPVVGTADTAVVVGTGTEVL